MLIALIMLAFLLFLGLLAASRFRKTKLKRIYFILTAVFLFSAILIIVFDNRDLAGNSKGYDPPSVIEETIKLPDYGKVPKKTAPAFSSLIAIPDNEILNYKVEKEETLQSIAIRFGLSVEKIKQWNGLTTDAIKVNQILKLYGKNVEPQAPGKSPNSS